MNAIYNRYQSNQMTTASPEQLLIMFYDGAIRFVRLAVEALAAGERVARLEATSRALAIIAELSNTLDHEIGGEIATNLDALYHFMQQELIQGNLQSDADRYRTVEHLLCELRETWLQAIEIQRQEHGQSAAAAGLNGRVQMAAG